MKSAKYHECPACHRISPGLQMRCECGYRFTGDRSAERLYRTCSACGSLLPAGRIFCDCGRFLPFRDRGITQGDVDAAYHAGRVDGMTEERERDDAAWAQFFKDAQLKNTVTGAPVRSREDFRLWKRQFDAAKAERTRRNSGQQETVYMMETEDGFQVRVPASKLESWQKAQKEPDRPLTPTEEKVRDEIVKRVYGENPPPAPPPAKEPRKWPVLACSLLVALASALVMWAHIVTQAPTPSPPSSSPSTPSPPSSSTAVSSSSSRQTFEEWTKENRELTPLGRPSNGQLFRTPYGECPAPLKIETEGDQDYFVSLCRVGYSRSVMSFYVRGGQPVEVDVPLGEYEIYYTVGDVWYGQNSKFGPDGVYEKCDGTFNFYFDGTHYRGWTLELYPQYNGNMHTESIDAKDFPA